MVDINIHITLKDKKLLNDIKYKYHISYSTIANLIIYPVSILIGENIHKDLYKNERNYKSHIKPTTQWENMKGKEYTNAIKVFVRKDFDKFKNEKLGDKYEEMKRKAITMIYNHFQNTWEENWNGNHEARAFTRYIKKHPEYVRRLLEE